MPEPTKMKCCPFFKAGGFSHPASWDRPTEPFRHSLVQPGSLSLSPADPVMLRLTTPRAAGSPGCLLRAAESNEVLQCHLPGCYLEWLYPTVYLFPSDSVFHGFSILVLLRKLFPSQSETLRIYHVQWGCTLRSNKINEALPTE